MAFYEAFSKYLDQHNLDNHLIFFFSLSFLLEDLQETTAALEATNPETKASDPNRSIICRLDIGSENPF